MDEKNRQPAGQNAKRDERGQTIVLLVVLMVGLLAAAGIAVDVGFIFARRSQFSAAVDAAALAGVVELHQVNGLANAQARAEQFLDANGWPITEAVTSTAAAEPNDIDIPEFVYTVTWPVETFFLRILGFEEVEVTHAARAAYHVLADMPTATQVDRGQVRLANLFIIGQDGYAQLGDAISPAELSAGVVNPDHILHGGSYLYRIVVPAGYITETGQSRVYVQLFDPDASNFRTGNETMYSSDDGSAIGTTGCVSPNDICVWQTGEAPFANPFWLVRVDKTDGPCAGCGTTVTEYELFYNANDGTERTVGTFISQASNAAATDMRWVTPGIDVPANFGSFSVDLKTIPYLDDNRNYNLYLRVTAKNGSSMNGFDIWAGHPDHAILAPSNVNDRNIDILKNWAARDTRGIAVLAQGFLPVTVYPATTNAGNELPLALVPAAMGGGRLYATAYDFDYATGGARTVNFSFDTVGSGAYNVSQNIVCDGSSANCNANWADAVEVGIPCRESDCPGGAIPFYGGYLVANYSPARDQHVWSIRTAGGRPFLTR